MHKSLRGSLMLLLAAMVWGFAFVAQRVGMNSMQPLSFNGIRTLLSGVCLLPVLAVTGRRNASPPPAVPSGKSVQLRAGLLCGFFLFLATNLQQAGLVYTDAGKSGFITALYVVLVPVFNYILFRKNPGRWVWVGVAMAVAALFLLCVPTGQHLTLNRGDLLTLGCALCFTGHILTVDYFSPKVDPIRLSCHQFLFSGSLALLISLFTETVTWEGIRAALPALLYAGIISGAVGYTLQIVGQKSTPPALASLLMCMESVFAVLSGALILGERMSPRESWGCVIMFAAVVIAQLSPLLHAGAGRAARRGP